jgi:threonine synthase
LQVIRSYAANDYLLDPHSAVAYYGASKTAKTGKMGVLCTAHWCKFEHAMQVAFDGKFTEEYPEKIKQLMRAEEQPYAGTFTPDKDWQAELHKLIKA